MGKKWTEAEIAVIIKYRPYEQARYKTIPALRHRTVRAIGCKRHQLLREHPWCANARNQAAKTM